MTRTARRTLEALVVELPVEKPCESAYVLKITNRAT